MRRALVLLAVAGCATAPGEAERPSTLVETVREACLETGMDRDAFRRLADERDWGPLLRVVRANDPVDDAVWELMFQAGESTVAMSGEVSDGRSSRATVCGVMAPAPAGDWRSEVEGLAAELRMRSVAADADPGVLETRAWANADARPSGLIYERWETAVVVSLEQPAVF